MLALTALLLAAAPATGTLDVEIDWDGGDPATCVVLVDGAEAGPPGPRPRPPGPALVGVRCPADEPLIPPPVRVEVRSDRTERVAFRVRRARLRFEARRNGTMLESEVAFYAPDADLDAAEPAFTRPANQRVTLAAGRFQAIVHLRADDQPEASVHLPRLTVAPGKNRPQPVDLSDGALTASARNNRRRAEGGVRVFRGETQVALGETGQEIRVPAGRYRVEVGLREAADFATHAETVWVEPKKTQRVQADFRTGALRVEVRKDGRAIPATVRMKLPLAGDFFNFFEAPGPVVLSAPREIHLVVSSPKARPLGAHEVKAVRLRPGRTTKVALDLTPARLRVKVTKNGRPTPLARATVREPGGGKTVAIVREGETRLWPGRYEVLVALGDGAEQVDGPFEVGLTDDLLRIVDFRRARLTVRALRGPAPEVDARVAIYKAEAAEPMYEVRAGEVVEVPAGAYDLKVSAGPDVAWRRRVEVAEDTRVDVALPELVDVELPPGEAPDPDFELPEGDAAESE